MSIRIVNDTAFVQAFGDIDEFEVPAGSGNYAIISVDDYLGSSELAAAISNSLVHVDPAFLTPAEVEAIGFGGGGALSEPNEHSDFTYDANDNVLTITTYPTGSGPGDPAKLTTFTYDANDNVLTSITTDTVLP